jgi:hypothetical protein
MRAKEFTSEAIPTIQPIGNAPVDQAIAQANQPKGPGLASRAMSGISTAASRFGQGFSQGFNSSLSSAGDALSKAGVSAGFAADVANKEKAEAPYKQAFAVFAGTSKIQDVDPAMIRQVNNILASQYPEQAGWWDHVKKNTTPWDTERNPLAGTATDAVKRINPNDVAAYLRTMAKGQKYAATGNPDIDKLFTLAGIKK